jgi:hypothetical protein
VRVIKALRGTNIHGSGACVSNTGETVFVPVDRCIR